MHPARTTAIRQNILALDLFLLSDSLSHQYSAILCCQYRLQGMPSPLTLCDFQHPTHSNENPSLPFFVPDLCVSICLTVLSGITEFIAIYSKYFAAKAKSYTKGGQASDYAEDIDERKMIRRIKTECDLWKRFSTG